MRLFHKNLTLTIVLCISVQLFGQEEIESHSNDRKNSHKKHNISVLWGNTIVPAAKTASGENSVLLFPSWGLNYEFVFSKHFGVALMNEFEMQSYVIEHDEHAEIEREYPIILSIVLIYEPVNRFLIFAGPGIEFEKTHNYSIIKAGIAYKFPLPKYFGIALELSYERKNKTYDAWTFGLLIGKGFGKTLTH